MIITAEFLQNKSGHKYPYKKVEWEDIDTDNITNKLMVVNAVNVLTGDARIWGREEIVNKFVERAVENIEKFDSIKLEDSYYGIRHFSFSMKEHAKSGVFILNSEGYQIKEKLDKLIEENSETTINPTTKATVEIINPGIYDYYAAMTSNLEVFAHAVKYKEEYANKSWQVWQMVVSARNASWHKVGANITGREFFSVPRMDRMRATFDTSCTILNDFAKYL